MVGEQASWQWVPRSGERLWSSSWVFGSWTAVGLGGFVVFDGLGVGTAGWLERFGWQQSLGF